MMRNLTELTVFMSCTSDLEAEKSALRAAMAEIDPILRSDRSITLRLLAWPEDFRPGVSIDAQAEVNAQIGERYDIFVGVLGTRFGSPTRRAGSGVEEEFQSAMNRYARAPGSLRVLFYFKRLQEDAYELDLDQFARVKDFRRALEEMGVLYREFRNTPEFATMARSHLQCLIADEWCGHSWQGRATSAAHGQSLASINEPADASRAVPSEEAIAEDFVAEASPALPGLSEGPWSALGDSDDEELGYLDLMDSFHEATERAVAIMDAVAAITSGVSQRISERTNELLHLREEVEIDKRLGKAPRDQSSKFRSLVNGAADDLSVYVDQMWPEVERFRIAGREMFVSLRRSQQDDFASSRDLDSIRTDMAAVSRLLEIMRASRDSLVDFQATIVATPALTGQFKRARRRAGSVLGELLAELSFGIEELEATHSLQERLVMNLEGRMLPHPASDNASA